MTPTNLKSARERERASKRPPSATKGASLPQPAYGVKPMRILAGAACALFVMSATPASAFLTVGPCSACKDALGSNHKQHKDEDDWQAPNPNAPGKFWRSPAPFKDWNFFFGPRENPTGGGGGGSGRSWNDVANSLSNTHGKSDR